MSEFAKLDSEEQRQQFIGTLRHYVKTERGLAAQRIVCGHLADAVEKHTLPITHEGVTLALNAAAKDASNPDLVKEFHALEQNFLKKFDTGRTIQNIRMMEYVNGAFYAAAYGQNTAQENGGHSFVGANENRITQRYAGR